MIRKINLFLKFLKLILIFEKKNINVNIQYLHFLINEVNLFKYFFFILSKRKNNPFKSEVFKKYLDANKKFSLNDINNKKHKKNIFVETFINQPGYTVTNGICASFLRKIYNCNLIGVIRRSDIKAELIFKSFGVKDFIYLKKPNLLGRIKYIYISLKLFQKKMKIETFCKIKHKGIELGLSSYDSYLRYTSGNPTLNYVNDELIVIYANALFTCDFLYDEVLKKKDVIGSVQAETVFHPPHIFFQICLKEKITVYSRCGENEISLRQYNSWNQRHFYRYNISQKIFDRIYKSLKLNDFNKLYLFYKKKELNQDYGIDTKLPIIKSKKLKIIDKKFLTTNFNWDRKKKVICFHLSLFRDRNFHSGPRVIFKDNYSFTKYMLGKIKKASNVNWIIKYHPVEKLYKSNTPIYSEIEYLEKKYRHIKVLPDDISNASTLNIADAVITSHGTAGIKYPIFGINSIFTEKSNYSNLNFPKMIRSKKKLDQIIKNIHRLPKVKNDIMKKSLTFLFIFDYVIRVNCSLIPVYLITRNINEDDFYNKLVKNIYRFKIKNDLFFKMLLHQIKFKSRHTIDYKKVKIKPRYLGDLEN
tara:strand:- start:8829 stop:10589 length:1761 start_codon:yes stop_codon:yes gene_type:complete